MDMLNIKMPEGAKYIIEQLEKNGYEAFIVGGCVRDALLGKEPNDWDITTSAKPADIKRIFKRTVDTGIEHGTVTVLTYEFEGVTSFEVTTYRVDGEYSDHRRPDSVSFTTELSEDLKRRDFTINAMAYNEKKGLIDIFDGQGDLASGVIKCVGNATERFDEDALRILRAIRFSAQLGFSIEESTKNAMVKQCKTLEMVSAERIQVELTKLIVSNHPEKLVEAYEMGITAIILPEFDLMMETKQNNPYHIYSVGMHTIKVMQSIEATPILRYTALLHDSGKPKTKTTSEDGVDHFAGHQEESAKIARTVLRRLKLDNNTVDTTCKLVKYHDFGIGGNLNEITVRRFVSDLGSELFYSFLAIRKADMAGQSDYRLLQRKTDILFFEECFEMIMQKQDCLKLTDMKISGRDLIDMGLKPGREIGEILKTLFDRVLEEPELNEEDTLKEMAKELLKTYL